MKKRKKLIQQNKTLADYLGMGILGGLMAFALSSAVVQYIDLDPWMAFSYIRIIISVFVTMSICLLLFRNWKTLLIGGAVILIAGAVISIIWFSNGFSDTFYTNVSGYIRWLTGFIYTWADSIKVPGTYLYTSIVGLSVLITVLMYFLVVKWFIYMPVFIMTVTLFVTQWMFAREVNKVAFYMAFALLLILYVISVFRDSLRRILKRGEGQKFLSTSRLIAIAAPVVALLIIIILLVPKSNEPIMWEWLDKKIRYINESGDKTVDIETYEEFSFNEAGLLNEPGTPGGSVKLDYTHVLDVFGPESLYLRGESWPYFNGTSWKDSSSAENYLGHVVDYEDYDANRNMLLEPIYGWRFMELDRWFEEDYEEFEGKKRLPGAGFESTMDIHLLPSWYELEKAEVVYAGVRTKTLFTPLYSELVSLTDLNNPTIGFDDTLDAENPVRLYTKLSFDYLSPDFENEGMLENLRRSEEGIYGRLMSNLMLVENDPEKYENILLSDSISNTLDTLNELNDIAKDNYWRYTELPGNLPQRVVELAQSITDSYDNDYDKVRAIEEFFRQGFTYSLDASYKPEGREFSDWFIFDTRTGYCTFYATSMTTLVRSIGLPARYVEGFLTPPKPISLDWYYVLNSNAHAWVEVYFEGIGWLSFDPTPPISEQNIDTGTPAPRPDIEDPGFSEGPVGPDDTEVPVIPTSDNSTGDGGNKAGGSWGWIIGGILIVTLALFNGLVKVGRKLLFRNINNTRRFALGYYEILRILAFRGFSYKKGMTLMELADKVDNEYPTDEHSMKDITSVYYRITYGGQIPEEEELQILGEYYDEIHFEITSEMTFWEHLLNRIIFPII